MFVKTKKALITLLTLMCVVCLCFSVGCKPKAEEKITLLEEADRPTAIVSREFDAMSIVSDTNGYDLILIECYYLDDQLQMVDIPVIGDTKFVPTVEKEVYITLKIKGGELVQEAVILVEPPVSELQSDILASWNDEGVGKVVTADPAYLTGGAESSIRATYNGSINVAGSGPCIFMWDYGADDTLPFSVTDWSNAVLTMDIYNPMAQDITIYYCIVLNRKTWTSPITGAYGQNTYAVLPAGQWTQAVLSLNMLGLDYNPFAVHAGEMYIAFRVAFSVAPQTLPYEWTMYLANIDITDYSEERFPDLETVRLDQKLDAMDGDATDKYILKHMLDENTDFRYSGIKTTGDIVAYSSLSGIEKPNAEAGDYVNKYTITAKANDTDASGPVVYSTPLLFKNSGYFVFSDEHKALDFSKAEISFDIYNPNEIDLPLYVVKSLNGYVNNANLGVATAKAGQWTNVKFDISGLDIGESYQFAISLGGFRTQYTTLDYYLDNLSIIEVENEEPETPTPEVIDADDEDAVKHLHASGVKWVGSTTVANVVAYSSLDGITKPNGVEGETLIKYNHTNPGNTKVNSVPLRYSFGDWDYAFNADQKALDFSKAAMSFYIYNASSTDLPIYFGYMWAVYPNGVNKGSATATAGEWTKVEVELADFSIDVNSAYEFYIFVGSNDIATDANVEYYIDGVTFYEKASSEEPEEPETPTPEVIDTNDENAIKHLYASGVKWVGSNTTAEVVAYANESISKPDGVEGDTLIKYVHTNPGNTKVNSVPLRYSSGDWDYAFNAEEKALDFSKAAMSFYIYNATDKDLPVYFGYLWGVYPNATNKGTTTAKAGEWTKVEVSLADFSINVDGSYEFYIFVGSDDRTTPAEVTYYIDNVTFYEVNA